MQVDKTFQEPKKGEEQIDLDYFGSLRDQRTDSQPSNFAMILHYYRVISPLFIYSTEFISSER